MIVIEMLSFFEVFSLKTPTGIVTVTDNKSIESLESSLIEQYNDAFLFDTIPVQS